LAKFDLYSQDWSTMYRAACSCPRLGFDDGHDVVVGVVTAGADQVVIAPVDDQEIPALARFDIRSPRSPSGPRCPRIRRPVELDFAAQMARRLVAPIAP